MAPKLDALTRWLSLTWERPERSYNPDLRDFLKDLLGYPTGKVVTEDSGPSGYPDLKLVGPEGIAWVVGDLKKDDGVLLDADKRAALWEDKRKYVDGLTRFVLFVTPRFVWVCLPDGSPHSDFPAPLDLRAVTLPELQARLAFLAYDAASHERQWAQFIEGDFPFSYLNLEEPETVRALRGDLRAGFRELTQAAFKSLTALQGQFDDYQTRRAEIERNLVGHHETQRRARVKIELEFEFVRRLFSESLPQFEEQYGRDLDNTQASARLREAFVADSVAALMARVLFLRLIEDLRLTSKRRLSNGGPRNWTVFVEYLTGDARAMVRVASEDVARIYREPFARTVFDWISHANGELDESLQRFILRLNGYDFAHLSEEILGDIYQQFLPLAKRKQLGEYYTPPSVVEWILDRTVRAHGLGPVLDPSCGSGSFLVRYAHWRLSDAAARNLDAAQTRADVQEEVWGFDLNPFAAFISLFQLTWALLRHHRQADPPHVHVYNLNSLLNDTDIVPFVGEAHIGAGSLARDRQKWKYILGNPPYIRAERVKYGGEMRDLWAHVWGQNSDTGLVFLYRALTEWLEPGGRLGMVVSGGYANSEAAAKVWTLLQPGGDFALRQVCWLEFVEKGGKPAPVWDVARVPLILIIERASAAPDDEIELFTPSVWPSAEPPVKVRAADFFDKRINPNGSLPASQWGDDLLPLLRPDDAPLLRKLYPDQTTFQKLGDVVQWTYGIQRGGVDVTDAPTGNRPLKITAGRSVAVGWPGEAAGWIDLEAVEARPFGKLSLWRQTGAAQSTVFVSEIASAPFAAVTNEAAAVNTVVVGRASSERANKAVAAYVNSKLARHYWALRLRSGVIQGYYAHIYPRTLENLPWPKNLTAAQETTLADGYDALANLAARAKDNPNEWLLAETDRRLTAGGTPLKFSDPKLGLHIANPTLAAPIAELTRTGNELQAGLFPFAQFADESLAEYIRLLLTLTLDEDAAVKPADVQKLVVPPDYAALMIDYRARWAAFQTVEADFRAALADVDAAVYDAFGLTQKEREIVEVRLSSFPLNRLQPRWPWQVVRPRPIKAYMTDRFA